MRYLDQDLGFRNQDSESNDLEEDMLEKEFQKKVMEYQKLESECDKVTAEILKMQTKVPLQTVTKSRSTSTGPSDDVRKKLREKRKKRRRRRKKKIRQNQMSRYLFHR